MSRPDVIERAERIIAAEYHLRLHDSQIENRHRHALGRRKLWIWAGIIATSCSVVSGLVVLAVEVIR